MELTDGAAPKGRLDDANVCLAFFDSRMLGSVSDPGAATRKCGEIAECFWVVG